MPTIRRLATLLALTLTATLSLVSPASAAESWDVDPTSRAARGPMGPASAAAPASSGRLAPAAASSEETAALARLNAHRSRAGLRPMSLTAPTSAVTSHANYLAKNWSVSGLNIYGEEAGLPGYTTAGAAIAPQTEAVGGWLTTYLAMVDFLMADPLAQYYGLLNPRVNQVAFTRSGGVMVMWLPVGAETSHPTPIVFPRGNNVDLRAMPTELSPFYTQNCGMTSASWGFPITIQYDPSVYGRSEVTSSVVRVDGRAVPHCVVTDTQDLGTRGQIVLIPQQPVPAGAYVSGSWTASMFSPDGTTARTQSGSFEMTTSAAVTKTPGDQTGDNTGDLVAVDQTGAMRLYKGVRPGRLTLGVKTGSGWSDFTWTSRVPDLTGDGRDDLIGRRSNGGIYFYTGSGMGHFSYTRQIGWSWNGLRNLTVVGDMNGDKKPEIVGIITSGPNAGRLARYTLSATGISGMALIGSGWGGIRMMTAIGDQDGNGSGDFLATNDKGLLLVYYTGGGRVVKTSQVGHGWTGWSVLHSPGDLGGDGRPDVLGRAPDGMLHSWETQSGRLVNRRTAGTGWNGIRLFS